MKAKKFIIFSICFILTITMVSAANQFAYNYIDFIDANRLGGFNPSFFMPLNNSVFGQFDFNGGWLNDGLSIIGGDLYAQTLFVFNITSLNVTKQNLTITDNLVIEGDLDLGFTQGSIPFQGANGLTEDNSNLFWDDPNKRLGIGTTTPSDDLHIYREVANDKTGFFVENPSTSSGGATRAQFGIKSDGARVDFFAYSDAATGNIIGVPKAGTAGLIAPVTGAPNRLLFGTSTDIPMFLNTGGTERIEIRGDGTIKIYGTDTSSWFNFGSDEDTYIRPGKNSGNVIMDTNDVIIGENIKQSDSKKHFFGDADDISLNFDSSKFEITGEVGSPDLVIDLNGGSVGIGVVPSAKLHVQTGTALQVVAKFVGVHSQIASFETSSGTGLFNFDANGYQWNFGVASGNFVIRDREQGSGNGRFVIASGASGAGDAEAMRINKDNEVGIGTTNPLARLHVNQIDNIDAFRVDDVVSDTTPFIIDEDGNVGIGTTTPSTKLDVNGSLNQTNGNATINLPYGELWIHDGLVVDFNILGIYENITDLNSTWNNGFSYDGNGTLTAQITGLYETEWHISYSGAASSEYDAGVGINGDTLGMVNGQSMNKTHGHRTIGTGGQIGSMSGGGKLCILEGDDVTMMMSDQNNPLQSATIVTFQLNLDWVGHC